MLRRLDGSALLCVVVAAFCKVAAAQNAAPYAPPKVLPVPEQRAGEVVILGAAIPVWVVPRDNGTAAPPAAPSPTERDAIPPPPRRARAANTLDGAADRADWRQPVGADGASVPLIDALARLAPPGIALDITAAPPERMQVPVSWFAGDTRANTTAALLAAAGLRGRADAGRLVVVSAGVQPPPTAAQWRARSDELLAQYEAARLAEARALRAEVAAQTVVEQASQNAAQAARELLAAVGAAQRTRESEPSPRVFVVRTWTVSPEDRSLKGVLARWAAVEGLHLTYAADTDWSITGEQKFEGPLPQAVGALVALLPPAETRLDVQVGATTLSVRRETQAASPPPSRVDEATPAGATGERAPPGKQKMPTPSTE